MSAAGDNGGGARSGSNGGTREHLNYSTGNANIRATLMLAENLIHALVEKGTFTPQEAVEIIETVADLEEELMVEAGETPFSLVAPLASAFRFELEQSD